MEKQITPRQKAAALRQFNRLLKIAEKAAIARSDFETAFGKAQMNTVAWKLMCEVTGTSVNSNSGDWMC